MPRTEMPLPLGRSKKSNGVHSVADGRLFLDRRAAALAASKVEGSVVTADEVEAAMDSGELVVYDGGVGTRPRYLLYQADVVAWAHRRSANREPDPIEHTELLLSLQGRVEDLRAQVEELQEDNLVLAATVESLSEQTSALSKRIAERSRGNRRGA